jgi:adenosylcobinamide kinase/adenosylcobinamide-phosphate guanylyltransferase
MRQDYPGVNRGHPAGGASDADPRRRALGQVELRRTDADRRDRPASGDVRGHRPGDAEWARRIARHQAQRPGTWRTVETGDDPAALAGILRAAEGPVLADCLTLWLTSAMDVVCAWDEETWASGSAPERLGELTRELTAGYEAAPGPVVAVSNELGFGLVPLDPGARRFRDELGRLNQAFAAAADEVWLVVAGLPLRLK